jgi:hypothetical protein
MTGSRENRRLFHILAGTGALLTILWLLAYLVPTARQMMLDVALAFLLKLVVVGLLGWAARPSTEAQRFWALLAAAWTLNLLGDVTWGVYEMLTEGSLPVFTWIDGLYIARYVLLFLALWRCSNRTDRRQWMGLVATVLAATATTWWGGLESSGGGAPFFLGKALYPILDAALIYAALVAWAHTPTVRLRNVLSLFALALVVYGAANWINFRVAASGASSGQADFFWTLADVLTGLVVLYSARDASIMRRS